MVPEAAGSKKEAGPHNSEISQALWGTAERQSPHSTGWLTSFVRKECRHAGSSLDSRRVYRSPDWMVGCDGCRDYAGLSATPVERSRASEKAAKPATASKSAAEAESISGQELFSREWIPNDSRSHGGDGLGPVFNDTSCVACHNLGGIGGGGPASKNVDLLSAFAMSFSGNMPASPPRPLLLLPKTEFLQALANPSKLTRSNVAAEAAKQQARNS